MLRDEWGFQGTVVTDSAMGNTGWMDINLALRAGGDMMLCLMGVNLDSSTNTAQQEMRRACHNILYTVAHSHAMNGIVPGTIISYTAAPWEGWLSTANIAVGALLAAGLVWVIFRVGKNRRRNA